VPLGMVAVSSAGAVTTASKTRQEDLERRATARFAVGLDVATRLLDEAVTIASPRPVPSPVGLVVKNGSKCARGWSRPCRVLVRHRHHDVGARRHVFVQAGTRLPSSSTLVVSIVRLPPCGMAPARSLPG
jgi:hypothetical protein